MLPVALAEPAGATSLKLGELNIHSWLYELHTGDLFTHDDKLEQWRALVSPEIIPSAKLNHKTLVAKH